MQSLKLERKTYTSLNILLPLMWLYVHLRDEFYRDIVRFDTQLQRWETGFDPVPFAEGRAYHAATVLGSEIWLTGGSSAHEIFSDILVFDTLTLTWKNVALRCYICLVSQGLMCFQTQICHEGCHKDTWSAHTRVRLRRLTVS